MNQLPYQKRRGAAQITCVLQPAGPVPLYEQLYRHIAGEVRSGRLAAGSRLPSRRALAEHLGLSTGTVEAAYGLLLDEGYLRASPRRGYFVRALEPLKAQAGAAPAPPPRREEEERPGQPDFSTSATDASLFPYKTWVRLLRDTLYTRPELLGRGEAQGDRELREALSAFLYEYRGLRCPPERLLIGAGVDYLLWVLLSLLPAGAAVAAEDPGYQGIYRACERLGRQVLPVPVDGEGMDAEALEASGADAAYVTPSHQFPLGSAMPIGRRTRLLAWAAAREGRYVIEDDYDSEFRYVSRPLPALQGLGDGLRTVYIGTFSRSLAPSMRIAYMALPPALWETWSRTYIKCGDTVSRFDQQTLARFIREGHYARHLRRARTVYEARMRTLREGLLRMPGASVTGWEAGLHFLFCLPRLSEEELLKRAAARGIRLRGVSEFCRKAAPPASTLVLGYAGLSDRLLPEALDTLLKAWA